MNRLSRMLFCLTLLLAISSFAIKEGKSQEVKNYTIQVAASPYKLSVEEIQRELGLTEPPAMFFVGGRYKYKYKYYIGQFSTLEEAENKIGSLNLRDAFATRIPTGAAILSGFYQKPEPETVPADTVAALKTGPSPEQKLKEDLLALYALTIRKADSAFYINENYQEARNLYQRAAAILPEKAYPKDQIIEADKQLLIHHPQSFFKNMSVINLLIIIIVVVMILVLIVTLILRTQRKRLTKNKKNLKEEYQESVTGYLFGSSTVPPASLREADSSSKRQVLIDEIMQIYANLSGEIANKLRDLYLELGLENESVQKTKSSQWHVRAKGFRELAQMNVQAVRDEIERCLNSNNENLRMEAQLAMIRLNYEDPFGFLSKLKQPFTDWEQLQVYDMIKNNQVSIPDFTRWLDSPNKTVSLFCIRMIRAFRQKQSFARLGGLLDHPDREVRGEVYQTFGELENPDALGIMKNRFNTEDQANKLLIIKAMARIPDDSNIGFLRGILEPDNDLRIEAARALSKIDSFGVKGIESVLRRSDEDLQAVARHILDGKISK